MKRALQAVADLFVGAVAGAVYLLFRLLPFDAASGLGGWLGRSIGPRLPLSRRARQNLRRAFPDMPRAKVEAVVRGMWDNLGRVAGEFPHLGRIELAGRLELVGREQVERLRDDGLPGIFVSGHLGNWEVMAFCAHAHGLPLSLVYRAANNPWVERLYVRGRRIPGGGLIPKGASGARMAMAALKEGGHLGMLIDQKMNDGIPVPFFGRDAMTAPALAQFALKFRCPVVPARVERLGGARFRVVALPPLELPDSGDHHADVLALTTRINALLEEWIRERPEQWLWLHRRWPD